MSDARRMTPTLRAALRRELVFGAIGLVVGLCAGFALVEGERALEAWIAEECGP